MAWSIFQQGGGQGAAVTWAQDFLKAAGLPVTPANVKFVYDWEVSEGGGGKYNPLNQGPVPGKPSLTTTGQQYGGGAADFASYAAGIQGAVDYLNMSSYRGVLNALKSGNNYQQAASALWASPWAGSHYGYGSMWSTSAAPGVAPLQGGSSATLTSTQGTGTSGSSGSSSGTSTPSASGGISNPLDFQGDWIKGAEGIGKFITGATFGKVTDQLSGLGGIGKGLAGIATSLSVMAQVTAMLTRPAFWLRVGAFIVGIVALWQGFHFLKQATGTVSG